MKTVFITGASRGIGYETALIFAKNGYDIGFSYLNSDNSAKKLEDSIRNLGQKVYSYKIDVRNYKEMEFVINDFIKKVFHIDVFVSNAGISSYEQINDIQMEKVENIFSTNVFSMINACKTVSRHMISQKKGSIINISSIWGISGASCESVYSASKGAIISFSKALAKELGPSGIRVNVVAPGVVMTDMMSEFSDDEIQDLKDKSALGTVSYPKDIAKTILFLSSEDSKSYTGQVLSPNCGILI